MPSYRLLRNNKESGPYSLNDLVALGLKPYDLVWVDGRSAAWRYPSEIPELKEYAPAVEEQPYDRFYKKPSETESPVKEHIASANTEKQRQEATINERFAKQEPAKNIPLAAGIKKPAETKENQNIPEIPVPKPYQQTTNGSSETKKKVFVSMPETNSFEQYEDTHTNSKYDQPQYEQYLPKPKSEQVNQKPIEERAYSPISVKESEESKLETKYTQSLDDIKEMYINTLVQRKTKNRRKEVLKRLRPALIPVLLLVVGVAIGYIIKSQKSPLQAAQGLSAVVPQQTIPNPQQTTPDQQNKEIPAESNNEIISPGANRQTTTEQHLVQHSDKTNNEQPARSLNQQQQEIQPQRDEEDSRPVPKAVLSEKKQKESFVPGDESVSFQKKNVEVDPNTGERKKVMRDGDSEVSTLQSDFRSNNTSSPGKKNRTVQEGKEGPNFLENDHKDLRDLVTVQSNNYIRGAFGGIRGLELTVYNNSDFLLDEVSVELQIMKPSEQPLRTDIITFKNIGSNKSFTVKVPDSQRGIRVDYRITNIESKQWQKSIAGL